MWNHIWETYRSYNGSGFVMMLFLLALIYLWLTEEKKYIETMLVYVSVAIIGIFFVPVFAWILSCFDEDEIFYRILWLLPLTITLAYTGAKMAMKDRRIMVPVAVMLIILSGSFVYRNEYFSKAENQYHIPQRVVDICDEIIVPGREVRAVFPSEMLSFVRQYTALVHMPYGREMVVERWKHQNDLYDLMEKERIDAGKLAELSREEECHYIILHASKVIEGSMEEEGYTLLETIEKYLIYRDNYVDLTVSTSQSSVEWLFAKRT